MPAANASAAIEALRSNAILLRDVFQFGRDLGYVQVDKENGVGFEQLEVGW